MSKPELMSPAGHWPQLHAAIEAGADAVYFGLNHFSARAKVGFDLEVLPKVLKTLHRRGVKGFVTFNTLVFDHELELAETAILEMARAGVDAIIVQDIGIAQLARKIAPNLEIHGSTQMSITSAQGAELARSLGCSRVVLGRELSLTDIRKIAESTDVELEVFVHGALCVSYSGQCFSSEAWGGRSANRGKCAQACRLSYDLIVDGERRDLGEYRYLLSPGDLCALEQIPELVEIGIACVKIEGRYKDADYVAATTRAYREAIDLACLGIANEISAAEKLELEQIYSRGLGSHFISGTNHQTVVRGRAPRHRGVLVGEVVDVSGSHVDVATTHPIKRGDGLVFDAATWRSPDQPEEGGNVYEVTRLENLLHAGTTAERTGQEQVRLEFGRGEIDFTRIRIGDLVWRTRDPQLNKRLRKLTDSQIPIFTRPVNFRVNAIGGLPIEIVAILESNDGSPAKTAKFVGQHPLAPADKRPLDIDMLGEKLGRLGGTPFHLEAIELTSDDNVFARTSELNEARRKLVDELLGKCGKRKSIPARPVVKEWLAQMDQTNGNLRPSSTKPVQLHLLVRTPEQLDAALALHQSCRSRLESPRQSENSSTTEVPPTVDHRDFCEPANQGIASITLDYLELYGLRPSVEKIIAAGVRPRVASPRILKPTEQNVIRFLTSLECDLLVRSGGLLNDLTDPSGDHGLKNTELQLIGDFSLNAANVLSCQSYLERGLARITPTYDLNAQQIRELTQYVPASSMEVIAYSHLPVFHTEHCVFCRFLSDGTDNTNCGHPCEKHQVAVRDAQGRAHPVMADVGCRNTVFGAQAQTDPVSLRQWQDTGIVDFRLEFVHQSSDQVTAISLAFLAYFSGQSNRTELETALHENSPQDITTGSLFVPKNFERLVQLN